MRAERKALSSKEKRIGRTAIATGEMGDAIIFREIMQPGWVWSIDMKPLVGTDLCRALHQIYVVSGRMGIRLEDGTELEVSPGDTAVIPPGHDGWVVGDEPCEILDLSPSYLNLVEASEAYERHAQGGRRGRARVADILRNAGEQGQLDQAAVELVLGARGHRPGRTHGPMGLTPREMEVLMLIATGASARQVAFVLGIAPKTATTHIERIYTKCGVSTRAEATLFAISHGLIHPLPKA